MLSPKKTLRCDLAAVQMHCWTTATFHTSAHSCKGRRPTLLSPTLPALRSAGWGQLSLRCQDTRFCLCLPFYHSMFWKEAFIQLCPLLQRCQEGLSAFQGSLDHINIYVSTMLCACWIIVVHARLGSLLSGWTRLSAEELQ